MGLTTPQHLRELRMRLGSTSAYEDVYNTGACATKVIQKPTRILKGVEFLGCSQGRRLGNPPSVKRQKLRQVWSRRLAAVKTQTVSQELKHYTSNHEL